jgi:hypothetical protein
MNSLSVSQSQVNRTSDGGGGATSSWQDTTCGADGRDAMRNFDTTRSFVSSTMDGTLNSATARIVYWYLA